MPYRVENIVRKGEIAYYKHLLFSQYFPQLYIFRALKCGIVWYWDNALPNDKILEGSKLKTLADDRINVAQKLEFVSGRVENIVKKGENAGYQHFFLFSQCFQKSFLLGPGLCGKELNVVQIMNFVYDRVENIVGKGEIDDINGVFRIFLSKGLSKNWDSVVNVD